MDVAPDTETTVSRSTVSLSLTTSRELLQLKVANYRLELLAEVRAVVAESLADAFAEIDRAIDKALVVPRLRSGAPPAEIAAVVRQATAVKEAVKEPLRQRLADFLAEDRRVADARAERANRRIRAATPVAAPVVTVVSAGAPPAPPTDRRMVLISEAGS